jgi:hypothetical protein
MYIRQNRVKNRLGTLLGEFGQIPTQSMTIADPVDGSQLTFSGPINEIAQVQVLVGMVSGAVSEAKKTGANFAAAKQALGGAKNILPATGSQRDKASFLVNKAEKFIAEREAAAKASGATAGEVLTGVGSILAALAPAAQTAIQTQADASAARRAARSGQTGPQTVYVPGPAAPASNTGLILAVVGGIAVVGILVVVMSKKK